MFKSFAPLLRDHGGGLVGTRLLTSDFPTLMMACAANRKLPKAVRYEIKRDSTQKRPVKEQEDLLG